MRATINPKKLTLGAALAPASAFLILSLAPAAWGQTVACVGAQEGTILGFATRVPSPDAG